MNPDTKHPSPDDALNILMALERSILHGLAAEWDLVQWRIPAAIRRRLRRPQFRITDMPATWGHWTAATNTITLSRRLIRHHPWDAIRDVLLHETAHQIADEMKSGAPASSHGADFQKACRMIGANAQASGDYPLLHARLDGSATTRDDIMRLKIRKLLAMSRSGNPNEAATALVKARLLMTRFQIQEGDTCRSSENYISVFAGRPELRHTRDHSFLGGLLADFYFVEAIWVPAWVLEKEKMGTVLEISGALENVQMAGYVYDYIRRFIDRQWQDYTAGRKISGHRKTDYAIGIIQGFRSQLESQNRVMSMTAGQGALITTSDPLLTAYVKQKYPRLRTVRSRAVQADAAVIQEGRRVGRRLRITTPVSGAPSTSPPSRLPQQERLPVPDAAD
ncbi:MAG: DUF2786 domain-containing protein [Pseudomonadota bacterium]